MPLSDVLFPFFWKFDFDSFDTRGFFSCSRRFAQKLRADWPRFSHRVFENGGQLCVNRDQPSKLKNQSWTIFMQLQAWNEITTNLTTCTLEQIVQLTISQRVAKHLCHVNYLPILRLFIREHADIILSAVWGWRDNVPQNIWTTKQLNTSIISRCVIRLFSFYGQHQVWKFKISPHQLLIL